MIGETGVDNQSSYVLGFENGAIATLTTTLQTYGTNEAVVLGTRGSIKLHDPFYRSWRITEKKFFVPITEVSASAPPRSLTQRLKSRLSQQPGLHKIRQRFDSLLRVAAAGRTTVLPYAGNGYQFEFAEATRCLQEGLTESPLMTHEDTMAVMRTMDAVRRPWKLRYPQDPSVF